MTETETETEIGPCGSCGRDVPVSQLSEAPSREGGQTVAPWCERCLERWEPSYVYKPRGLGLNWLPCFVCGHGGEGKAQADMSAFVESKEEGEAVVRLFWAMKGHAKLDYRDFEPHYVQVKAGACNVHQPNLELLCALTAKDGKLTLSLLKRAFPQPPKDLNEVLDKTVADIIQGRDMIQRGLISSENWPGDAKIILDAIDNAGYDVIPRGQ